ncbi:MAG: phenylacetate-CoA oxygenase subunit PaaJ [Flavobacteriales bacterium]|jgi:ring-1,2-phenylacetyl-CoA epoxidase subunit PaaD|nr:phenylacetate-CoA oxygenase subunit PaaJ [Flavobacteriales bacterium]
MISIPDYQNTIMELLEAVRDPEVPVLSIVDLGIVRAVEKNNKGAFIITITPTYSGCPAMDFIERDIRAVMKEADLQLAEIKTVLHPAWTTDWLSEKGRVALKEYGIAPPVGSPNKGFLLKEHKTIECPHCHSQSTEMISQFGSTACKALYKCDDCLEPFDYFKCI